MELARDGKENLDRSVNQMRSIQSTILNLSNVINDLGESANQIGEITDLIKNEIIRLKGISITEVPNTQDYIIGLLL